MSAARKDANDSAHHFPRWQFLSITTCRKGTSSDLGAGDVNDGSDDGASPVQWLKA